jgi:hypothetical protein
MRRPNPYISPLSGLGAVVRVSLTWGGAIPPSGIAEFNDNAAHKDVLFALERSIVYAQMMATTEAGRIVSDRVR